MPRRCRGIASPRVGLLNIGAEEEKGDTLRHETFALLTKAHQEGRINFIGNIEANDVMLGGADVVVADGFTGNVMLKTVEGTAKFLMKELKGVFMTSTKTKLAAAMVKGDLGPSSARPTPARWAVRRFWGSPGRHQGPRRLGCHRHQKCRPAGQGIRRKRLHPGDRGQHRPYACAAPGVKNLICY